MIADIFCLSNLFKNFSRTYVYPPYSIKDSLLIKAFNLGFGLIFGGVLLSLAL